MGAVREVVQRMTEVWEPAPDQLLAGGDLQMLRALSRPPRPLCP